MFLPLYSAAASLAGPQLHDDGRTHYVQLAMLTATSVLALGLLLGLRHATDPDHVIAVSTIATGERSVRHASIIGALWGVGHSLTILLVGGVIVAFRLAVPRQLELSLELAVAAMLILLGVRALGAGDREPGRALGRPVLIGFVHGLAGSAFVAMLVLAAVPGTALGLGYLAMFGVGTIVSMTLITAGIALPSSLVAGRFTPARRALRLASAFASIAFGIFLAHQVGVVEGLFALPARP